VKTYRILIITISKKLKVITAVLFVKSVSVIESSNPNLANGTAKGLTIVIKRPRTPPSAPRMSTTLKGTKV